MSHSILNIKINHVFIIFLILIDGHVICFNIRLIPSKIAEYLLVITTTKSCTIKHKRTSLGRNSNITCRTNPYSNHETALKDS